MNLKREKEPIRVISYEALAAVFSAKLYLKRIPTASLQPIFFRTL